MPHYTLPSVLAFDRKLEPSDALMFSGNFENINNENEWKAIELFERRNRAVKSNFKPEVLDNEEELQKQIAEPNLAWGDDASLSHNHDTLKLSFTLRINSGINEPSVCNNAGFKDRYNEVIAEYIETNIDELANRYAYNIANGRFLWRNRVGGQKMLIFVNHPSLEKDLEFDAYAFSLGQTTSDNPKIKKLADLIKAGLKGDDKILLKIKAFVQLGNGQRVWPSQEMVLGGASGEKSRHLFSLSGDASNERHAAMHCEKIGNALRTIDDWYPKFAETKSPIAIEAYGSVTQRGVAYRSSRNDFKTLLLKWLSAEDTSQIDEKEKHFVVAMLIRGGVFGEGES